MTPADRPQVRVIQTRYRDIPFEEAVQCHYQPHKKKPDTWERRRGKETAIVRQAARAEVHWAICDGPFWWTSDHVTVCPHIAEIGD